VEPKPKTEAKDNPILCYKCGLGVADGVRGFVIGAGPICCLDCYAGLPVERN
jgi:hypothetical protein